MNITLKTTMYEQQDALIRMTVYLGIT